MTATVPVVRTAEARVSSSLTAAGEKRLLLWIAARLPLWVNSDLLTGLGFGAQVGAGLAYAAAHNLPYFLFLVNLLIVVNWFGDSLDGTVARVRNQQRPKYGYYVDHICDVFGSGALLCGMAFSGYLHWQVALALLIAFLVLAAEAFLATYSLGRFELSQAKLGPTEIRLLLCAGNVAAFAHPYATLAGHRWLLFDVGGVIGAAGMLVIAVFTAVRHTRELYQREPALGAPAK